MNTETHTSKCKRLPTWTPGSDCMHGICWGMVGARCWWAISGIWDECAHWCMWGKCVVSWLCCIVGWCPCGTVLNWLGCWSCCMWCLDESWGWPWCCQRKKIAMLSPSHKNILEKYCNISKTHKLRCYISINQKLKTGKYISAGS